MEESPEPLQGICTTTMLQQQQPGASLQRHGIPSLVIIYQVILVLSKT